MQFVRFRFYVCPTGLLPMPGKYAHEKRSASDGSVTDNGINKITSNQQGREKRMSYDWYPGSEGPMHYPPLPPFGPDGKMCLVESVFGLHRETRVPFNN